MDEFQVRLVGGNDANVAGTEPSLQACGDCDAAKGRFELISDSLAEPYLRCGDLGLLLGVVV